MIPQLLLTYVFSKALVGQFSAFRLLSSMTAYALQPLRCTHIHPASTPTFKLQSLIMRFYQTLALLALAVSTASPAFSAPVLYASRFSTLRTALADEGCPPSRGSEDIGSILKRIGTGVGVGALPVVSKDLLGGNSMRRALPRDTDTTAAKRASAAGGIFNGLLDKIGTEGSIGEVLGSGLLGGLASGAGALGVSDLLNNTR